MLKLIGGGKHHDGRVPRSAADDENQNMYESTPSARRRSREGDALARTIGAPILLLIGTPAMVFPFGGVVGLYLYVLRLMWQEDAEMRAASRRNPGEPIGVASILFVPFRKVGAGIRLLVGFIFTTVVFVLVATLVMAAAAVVLGPLAGWVASDLTGLGQQWFVELFDKFAIAVAIACVAGYEARMRNWFNHTRDSASEGTLLMIWVVGAVAFALGLLFLPTSGWWPLSFDD